MAIEKDQANGGEDVPNRVAREYVVRRVADEPCQIETPNRERKKKRSAKPIRGVVINFGLLCRRGEVAPVDVARINDSDLNREDRDADLWK